MTSNDRRLTTEPQGCTMDQIFGTVPACLARSRVLTEVQVLYLFVIETLNSACDMAMMWQALIQDYGTS